MGSEKMAMCLHKEIERSGTKMKIECPTCQRCITIPEGGVNAIPQNLHLGFEVEMAGYMSKIGSDGEKSCDACIDGRMGPAMVFCCTCHHFLCKLCHDYHMHNKILCHHRIVGLHKESLKLLPSIMKPTGQLYSQPLYVKEELKLYCETCQSLICRDYTLHKDHRIAEICNIAKVHRDTLREALVCAQNVTSKVTRAIDANDRMAEQVETFRENATLIMNQAFERLHQTVEKRKKTLFSEMEAISLSKTTALTLQKEELMKIQDEIGRYNSLGDLLPTELKAILQKELSTFGHVMDSPPSPSQSTWSSESVAKVKGMYYVKVKSMSSKGERYPYGGLQVKAELRSKSYKETVVPTPDGFDTVSVQNVGSTYIIVSWDLPTHSNGILINFSLYCNGALAGVLPLTVISYDTTGLLLFPLYMYMSSSHAHRHCTPVGTWCCVISAAASLPSTLSFQPSQHEKDSPPGGPPDPESDTNDIVISGFINKIINPDKSFGSSWSILPHTFMTPTSTVVYVGLGA
eukprot:Em0001g1376a